MQESEQEFQARLVATFKAEAEGYVRDMASGLLALENTPDWPERSAIIERVYRQAHSLKGAARAVSFGEIECLCQSLESVLALLKAGVLNADEHVVDVLLRGIDQAGLLLNVPPGQADPSMLAGLLMDLEAVAAGAGEGGAGIAALRQCRSGELQTGATRPEAPSAAAIPARKEHGEAASESDAIRVSARKLENVLSGAEEMAALKYSSGRRAQGARSLSTNLSRCRSEAVRLFAALTQELGPGRPDLAEALSSLEDNLRGLESEAVALHQLAASQHRLLVTHIDFLLQESRKLLMRPFSVLFEVVPRMVREMARSLGKEVELKVRGARIEIDRRMLEALKEPLIHILRNALDHGIEPPGVREAAGKPRRGLVSIEVSQTAGGRIRLAVADDGAGVDPEEVRESAVRKGVIGREEAGTLSAAATLDLVFRSEVSTSRIITELSGRGLGLAIVREAVERIGGHVRFESTPGRSSVFVMTLPLTMAAFRVVLVRAGESIFAIPSGNIERVMRLGQEAVIAAGSGQALSYRGQIMPLARLDGILRVAGGGRSQTGQAMAVLLTAGDRRAALEVDEIVSEREILLKPLPWPLERVRHVSGVAAMPNGEIVAVLNTADLIRGMSGPSGPARGASAGTGERVRSILIAEDSVTSRMLLKNILSAAGYKVDAVVDGVEAMIALNERDYDLLLSDVEMPRMNGFELTARIRADERLSRLPVVLVTSLGSSLDRERGIDVGANAYIVKSGFDQSNLLDVVRKLL